MTTPPVLLAMLLLAVPSDTARQSNTKQDQRAQQQSHTAKTTEPTADAIKPVTNQRSPTNTSEDNTRHKEQELAPWSQRLVSDPVAVLTLLILFVYIGLFWLGWRQTNAVIKAADAASSAAATAQRALESVERPDVLLMHVSPDDDTVSSVDQYPGWVIGPETVFEVTVKNFGRTTARHLTILGFLAVDPMPPLAMPMRVVEVPEVLGAGDTYKFKFLPVGNAFDQQTLEQVMEGTVQLWVQANIEYVGFVQHSITGHGFYDASLGEFSITHSSAERPLS